MGAGEAEVFEAVRRAADAVADAEVGELVAQARLEARAKVRSILVEAMTHALLERSPAELTHDSSEPSSTGLAQETTEGADDEKPGAVGGPTAPPPAVTALAATPQKSSALAGELGWYVYCVVGSGLELPGPLPGVARGHGVRLLPGGDLAAVVSAVPLSEFGEETLHQNLNDAEWLERTARAHEGVVDEVGTKTTVIPMRLCTIYRSEDSVRQMLSRELETLSEGLTRLSGKREWGVKMFAERPLVERAAKEANAELAKLEAELTNASSGAAYMHRKQLERLRNAATTRLVDECVDDVHARLSALAVEARLNPPQHPEAGGHSTPMVLNAAYLLQESATDDFHACVAELSQECVPSGFALQTTGPWPPYNFVERSTEAA